MPLAQLIDATRLAARLTEPSLRVFDCRFALDDPGYGQRSFDQAHIPGAVYLDLERDLSGPVTPGQTGRHPLPQPDQLIERLRAAGLDDGCDVVLYDDGPGAFAARAWWLLAWLGKRQGVWLLDGGYKAWREAGADVTADPQPVRHGHFTGTPDNDLLIDAPQIAASLDQPSLTLLDARALPRFLGEEEPIDPVAGHIPGAQCMPFAGNLGQDGRFLDPQALQARFAQYERTAETGQLVAYCGSGVTACHNLFALCLAGYPLAKLYAGSWSEWITDPQRPVA
ncbi:sulfurtransferase [Pseudomonas stutzeri]|uniref:Sulfurtransferase n=1 Tax=Stutzerimonas stutzeri TaxID=316 RepID=A0A2N8SN85_STUST|nr:sulfurtransferase [Stutzerimonas stutzeri]MCQ4250076.1 sulfurtransferase [Stutzerimonas stutzeri]PNG03948.1 sulfurtransferase [Stutzerimonas stutzeri]